MKKLKKYSVFFALNKQKYPIWPVFEKKKNGTGKERYAYFKLTEDGEATIRTHRLVDRTIIKPLNNILSKDPKIEEVERIVDDKYLEILENL